MSRKPDHCGGRRPGLKQLNKVKSFLRKPHNLILLFFLVTLSYLVVVPLISIVGDTFVVHNSELMRIKGSQVGDFTLYHWQKVLFDSGSAQYFLQTIIKLSGMLPSAVLCSHHCRRWFCMAGNQNRFKMEKTDGHIIYVPIHHAVLDTGSGMDELL